MIVGHKTTMGRGFPTLSRFRPKAGDFAIVINRHKSVKRVSYLRSSLKNEVQQ